MDYDKLIEELYDGAHPQNKNWKAATAIETLRADLNAAKSPEVLEAVDELMEFARTRMSTADWLYYVDVLGGWRGQKED